MTKFIPYKIILLAVLLILGGMDSYAQSKDPSTWSYVATRKFGNHFELFFKVKLATGWHVYALDPGGDESLVPPTFTFTPNSKVKMIGKMKEMAKPITEQVDGIDKPVHYFKESAVFVQEIEVPRGGPITITGSHEYQLCNDQICLPPKSKNFSFTVKP